MITVRAEKPEDAAAIRALNEGAFGRPVEARIVDRLRAACGPDRLSLVAEDDGAIIGHILFSPVTVKNGKNVVVGMGLAPMAVAADRQNQGIGSLLIRHGLEALQKKGCPFVIVLGHPDFYPRFGFVRASARGLRCPWKNVPDETFMVLILNEEIMKDVKGIARYRPEFNESM